MKPRLHIYEGAQGAGKTTVTNIHRDRQPYTNLLRLSGINDKTLEGRTKIFKLYRAQNEFLGVMGKSGMNVILDRTFFSERNYCMCGYKSYDFENEYMLLLRELDSLRDRFDIYFILLTADEQTLTERLNRDKPQFIDVKFTAENSLRQQDNYLQMFYQLKRKYPMINSYMIDTTGKDPYDIVNDIMEGSK